MLLQTTYSKCICPIDRNAESIVGREYTQPSKILFNASIGQHVRHIIELFLCLEQGYESGVVNYEKRKRDYQIETNKDFAIQLLKEIYHRLDRPNADLVMEAENYEDTVRCGDDTQ